MKWIITAALFSLFLPIFAARVTTAQAEICERMSDYPVNAQKLMDEVPEIRTDWGRTGIEVYCEKADRIWAQQEGDTRPESAKPEERKSEGIKDGKNWLIPLGDPTSSPKTIFLFAERISEEEIITYRWKITPDQAELMDIEAILASEPEKKYAVHYDTETFQYIHGNLSASYYLEDGLVIRDDPFF